MGIEAILAGKPTLDFIDYAFYFTFQPTDLIIDTIPQPHQDVFADAHKIRNLTAEPRNQFAPCRLNITHSIFIVSNPTLEHADNCVDCGVHLIPDRIKNGVDLISEFLGSIIGMNQFQHQCRNNRNHNRYRPTNGGNRNLDRTKSRSHRRGNRHDCADSGNQLTDDNYHRPQCCQDRHNGNNNRLRSRRQIAELLC